MNLESDIINNNIRIKFYIKKCICGVHECVFTVLCVVCNYHFKILKLM